MGDGDYIYEIVVSKLAGIIINSTARQKKIPAAHQRQRSLMLTGDFFKKIIITKDAPAPYYNDDGVLVMSVYDFLLDEGSLDN